MSKAKHTPGPWSNGTFVDINGAPSIGFNIGHSNQRTEESLANARLISAAPELLEALDNLLGAVCDIRGVDIEGCYAIEEVAKARAALAKARGE